MYSYFLSRYFIFTLLLLLGVALLNAIQPVPLGFIVDVIAPPALCLLIARGYYRSATLLTTSERARLVYALAIVDALLQFSLIFIQIGTGQPISYSDALLSFFGVVVFHTLMIHFALRYASEQKAKV